MHNGNLNARGKTIQTCSLIQYVMLRFFFVPVFEISIKYALIDFCKFCGVKFVNFNAAKLSHFVYSSICL